MSKLFAIPTATPAVHDFVARINLMIWDTPAPETGAGVARAETRLAERCKFNKTIPSTPDISRQQARQQNRMKAKELRETDVARARRIMFAVNKARRIAARAKK